MSMGQDTTGQQEPKKSSSSNMLATHAAACADMRENVSEVHACVCTISAYAYKDDERDSCPEMHHHSTVLHHVLHTRTPPPPPACFCVRLEDVVNSLLTCSLKNALLEG